MNSPVATCIIIVYNGEAFLDEAIQSVIQQSFRDWELIIADDGSSDASRDIARRHTTADPRIRLVAHPDQRNHGMSATRNLGLSHSRGDYVGFLDADDVWEPTKLEEQLGVLADHPDAAMVYGRTLIWNSWETTAVAEDFFYDLGVPPNRLHAPPLLFRNLLRNVYQTPTTCNALMRSPAIEEVGGFDESFPAMFEDQIFFAKILLHFPVFVSNQAWAKYRQHTLSSSATSAAADADDVEHLRYLKGVHRYLNQQHRLDIGDRVAVARTLATVRRRHWTRRMTHRLMARKTRPW